MTVLAVKDSFRTLRLQFRQPGIQRRVSSRTLLRICKAFFRGADQRGQTGTGSMDTLQGSVHLLDVAFFDAGNVHAADIGHEPGDSDVFKRRRGDPFRCLGRGLRFGKYHVSAEGPQQFIVRSPAVSFKALFAGDIGIMDKIKVISVADIFAAAIENVYLDKPMSKIYD